jgi:hypothetical protein
VPKLVERIPTGLTHHNKMHRCAKKLNGLLCGILCGLRVVPYGQSADAVAMCGPARVIRAYKSALHRGEAAGDQDG